VPPGFLEQVRAGDVIVGGSDFGIGSSRQQAAETLKLKGIRAVVADSIHRIFFRNFWNLGCAAIELPGVSDAFKTGDEIEIDLEGSLVRNVSTGKELKFELKVPDWFLEMVEAGGLIPYHKQKPS
jgi:3-isopropylmalate/(R)-2-methylmalate dehydratase small subunit